jgi:chemotaxis protein MotB
MKTMRKWCGSQGTSLLACGLLLSASGCGHSEEEWQQAIREGEAIRAELKAQERAAASCDAEYQASQREVEDFKRALVERGVNLKDASASLEVQRQALHEYNQRAEQLERRVRQLDALRAGVQTAANPGVTVGVMENRLSIRVPADSLFSAGQDVLSTSGKALLTRISATLSHDPELSARDFQVGAHTDDKPAKGRPRDDLAAAVGLAKSVVAYLVGAKDTGGPGMNPAKWSAVGYGSSKPLADNATDAGRSANRRIEIQLVPSDDETLNWNALGH